MWEDNAMWLSAQLKWPQDVEAMGMEDYPETLLEFEQQFTSDEACREYLCYLRWPDGFRCPRRQHDKAWLTRRKL